MGIGTGGVTPRSERSEQPRDDPRLLADPQAVPPPDVDSAPRAAYLDRVRRERQSRVAASRVPDPDRYDDIVQRLFAVGLALRATQRRCVEHSEVANRIGDHLNELQGIIIQLRSAGIAESQGLATRPSTVGIPSPIRREDQPPGRSCPPSSP